MHRDGTIVMVKSVSKCFKCTEIYFCLFSHVSIKLVDDNIHLILWFSVYKECMKNTDHVYASNA